MHRHKLLGTNHIWLDRVDKHLARWRLEMMAGEACDLALWCLLSKVLGFHVVCLHLLS